MSNNGSAEAAHQARFHEEFFEINSIRRDSYLREVSNVSRIITTDYPDYFGDKNREIICEIGGGRGALIAALLEQGYEAFGCEYSAKLVEAARTHLSLSSDKFFQLDALDLPAYLVERSVRPTTLIMWHVIEHIEGSLNLIESLVKVCSEELTIIIQTPLPVPAYVYPEHLFFPSTETFHYLAERLNLPVKLLYVIPYTRYVTCILSNKKVPNGAIYPKESGKEGFSVVGQLIAQLNAGLIELDGVTKDQYAAILRLESQCGVARGTELFVPKLAEELSVIRALIGGALTSRDGSLSDLQQQLQELHLDNQRMRAELLRAEAQLDLLKDVLFENRDEDRL